MKKIIAIVLAVTMLLTLAGVSVAAKTPDVQDNSNGAPSGAHFNLNVIGWAQSEQAEPIEDGDVWNGNDDNNGHRIFIPLKTTWLNDPKDTDGTANEPGVSGTEVGPAKGVKIKVTWGTTFDVIDCDATDGEAILQMPEGGFDIYVRALGKPGGYLDLDAYIIENNYYYLVGHVDIDRPTGGHSRFEDISRILIYGSTPVWEYDEYFWQLYNNGLRLAQFRFYYTD